MAQANENKGHPNENTGHGVSRRTFLGYAAGGIAAFMASTIGFISLGGVLSPAVKSKKSGHWMKLGRTDDFQPDRPRKVDLEIELKDGWMQTTQAKSVWVVRSQSGEFMVFNSRCTHLGCIVSWKDAEKRFLSPCHDGVFNLQGKVVGGPPPRALDALEHKVENGELWCNYEDFVLGVPEKNPV
jgi:Rieske Fe-S protein